jgi:hypothetical protein
LEKRWTQSVAGRPRGKASPWWTKDRGTAAAHRSSTGRAMRLAGGHREERGRERKERRCCGAFTGDGEAAKLAGGEEALRHPLELDAAIFWAWRRGAIGGDGRGVEWWCSRGLYVGWSRGEEAVRQGKGPVAEWNFNAFKVSVSECNGRRLLCRFPEGKGRAWVALELVQESSRWHGGCVAKKPAVAL